MAGPLYPGGRDHLGRDRVRDREDREMIENRSKNENFDQKMQKFDQKHENSDQIQKYVKCLEKIHLLMDEVKDISTALKNIEEMIENEIGYLKVSHGSDQKAQKTGDP